MPEKHALDDSVLNTNTILPPEIDFIDERHDYNRLTQAVLIKYFQEHSRFQEKPSDIPLDWQLVTRMLTNPHAVRLGADGLFAPYTVATPRWNICTLQARSGS